MTELTKNSVLPWIRFSLSSAYSTSSFSPSRVDTNHCESFPSLDPSSSRRITGWCKITLRKSSSASLSVADMTNVWHVRGIPRTTLRTSSSYPYDSTRSASSITSVPTLAFSDATRSASVRCATMRPGVVTRISGRCCSTARCASLDPPPRSPTEIKSLQ